MDELEEEERRSNRERLLEEIEALQAIYLPVEDYLSVGPTTPPPPSLRLYGRSGVGWRSELCRPRRAAIFVKIVMSLPGQPEKEKSWKARGKTNKLLKQGPLAREEFSSFCFLVEPEADSHPVSSMLDNLVEPLVVEVFTGLLYPSAEAPLVTLTAPWLLTEKTNIRKEALPKWTAESAAQRLHVLYGASFSAAAC